MVAKPISVSVGRRVMEALTVSAGRDRCEGGMWEGREGGGRGRREVGGEGGRWEGKEGGGRGRREVGGEGRGEREGGSIPVMEGKEGI